MPLALIGGEEFADGFEDVHARLLEDVLRAKAKANGGSGEATIAFLPTCAAHDGPQVVESWCDRARVRLGMDGARVLPLPIADRASANDPANVRALLSADWIYLGGGVPHVGMSILAGTPVLEAILERYARGALLAGASAGAMMLCARTWMITSEMQAEFESVVRSGNRDTTPQLSAPSFIEGLNLIPQALCFPHFNVVPSSLWLQGAFLPPGLWMIGVDEQTALTNTRGQWEVLGRGSVALVSPEAHTWRYPASQVIRTLTPERIAL
jgi:cyanophycinase